MAKKKSSQRPAHRPTTYKKAYCQQIVKFFELQLKNTVTSNEKGEVKEVANSMPFITAFARSIKSTRKTLWEWGKKHEDFSNALKKAKEI